MDDVTWVLVGASYVLFASLIATTLSGIWFYARVQRWEAQSGGLLRPEGVLPRHVIDTGVVLLLFAVEAVLLNTLLPLGWLKTVIVAINVIAFAFGNRSIFRVTRFEYRRYRHARPRPRLPSD